MHGGLSRFTPCENSTLSGSYEARTSAKIAQISNPPRISRPIRALRWRRTLPSVSSQRPPVAVCAGSTRRSADAVVLVMRSSFRSQPRVEEGVADVDDQVDDQEDDRDHQDEPLDH